MTNKEKVSLHGTKEEKRTFSLNTERRETKGKPQKRAGTANITKSEYGAVLQVLGEIQEELRKHKEAITYLLHHNKHFQNEIQKEKFKETQKE